MDISATPRTPSFLEGVSLERKVESASFLGEHRRALARTAALEAGHAPPPADVRPAEAAMLDELGAVTEVVAGEMVSAAGAPAPAPGPAIDMSRMEAAIDRLRMFSERLGAEARSDVLELGLMIARKVVEGELAVNADRLISVVKSAVARVGESRKIVVHLSPADVALIQGDKGGPAGEPVTSAGFEKLSRGAAKVEVVADPTLSRGDCVVESDHLTVDGRLDAKFSEIRRALLETAWEEGA